ncbi:U-box domain-containing protein 27 [Linum grandiflorum]
MLLVLKQGSRLDSRIGTVRILQSIAIDAESKLSIAESDGLLSQLVNSIGLENDLALIEASLSCLISISTPKRVKSKLVDLKTIGKLREILRRQEAASSAVSTTEKALKLLESVSSCREGRAELCGDAECVEAVVRKAMKVSEAATEVAVTILWSLCYLFRDQRAAEAVVRSNGLTRILLLMQSNCSPAVRQMSTDMLRIFRVNSKSCLSSYDTKTTHIMPF